MCVVVGCNCINNPLGSGLDIDIQQNEANSENLFFLSTGEYLYGFDKVTYDQKVKIKFNTFIAHGDKTPDGRVLLSDQGSSAGNWGARLLVLDKDYNLIKEMPTNPTPTEALVFGGHIFVGSASMTSNAKFELQIFNASTYALEKKIAVDNILIRDNYSSMGNDLYISVGDYRALEDIAPYILKVNLTNLEAEKYQGYTPSYDTARIANRLFDTMLVVTTPAAPNGHHVTCIDVRTGTTISGIRLDTIAQVQAGLNEPILLPPCLVNDKLYYILQERPYPSKKCRLVCLTYPQLSVESVRDLDYGYRLIAFDYYYLDNTTLVIYSKDNGLGVISFPEGTLLKHVDLE